MKRIVSEQPITCEHCGYMPDCFVKYDDDSIIYCAYCIHADGDINEAQLKTDALDDLKMYKRYLATEMRRVDEKIAEFFGHTLDKGED